MDSCSYISRLSAYHDGELSPQVRDEVERHVLTCIACQLELRELNRVSALFKSKPVTELSSNRFDRLYDHVESLTDRSILRFAQVLVGVAASVLLITGLWGMEGSPAVEVSATGLERAAVSLQPGGLDDSAMLPAQMMLVGLSSRHAP
ncbi:MAG TPA: zf-HC2 domain-containing protein [Tepidisphaeraceae bacterium]|nr:zf-HC2 domain-containing protein [Tepidisphaeraceae bacterium]